MALTPPAITVIGTLRDIFGQADVGSSVIFQLANYGPYIPRIANSNLIANARPSPIQVDGTGAFSKTLYGNDVIIPANTYYTLSVEDDASNRIQTQAYQFTGSGTVDIGGLAPYNPTPPPFFPIQYQYADLFLIGNPLSPNPAPIGRTFTLSRTPAQNVLAQLYYNGVLNLPGIHYTLTGRQITLNFDGQFGDNIYVVYVAITTPS